MEPIPLLEMMAARRLDRPFISCANAEFIGVAPWHVTIGYVG
ncbi:hypothetical protein [Paraburkholderia translucens]|nr:hypothetical protein [Paraburkholderia sp. MMS20-SJTN17]